MNDLTKLSIQELLILEKKINAAIVSKKLNMDFWEEQKQIQIIENEKDHLDEKLQLFISNTTYTKNLKDIGFNIVYYSHHDIPEVSFIDYSKPKREGQYYSLGYSIEKDLIKERDDVSDEDFNKVQKVLQC